MPLSTLLCLFKAYCLSAFGLISHMQSALSKSGSNLKSILAESRFYCLLDICSSMRDAILSRRDSGSI